ncbi:hypothetical protein [Flammeovirga sp. EKP202]|uniref:hypothetical protein n=1 Tax=Flammeovirga sp. EKP202 TaxID=2770592 RepID=UPI00165F1F7C|nr:hypothetical protein [Flammeovirga sp. EKP202]MBD0401695.1 hypothetical protein [Flammeovirga sp. EKP202]
MKLSVSRLELSAKINWGRKHLTSILKKTLPLLGIGTVISFTAIPYPIFETWIKGFTFLGIPSLLYFGSSAILYLTKGKSKIRCTNEELHIQNGKTEFRIPTQQIAQFYLKYNSDKTRNSDHAKVDLMLITKDHQKYDCFNAKGLPAKDGRELEDTLQQFLGIEDYYVEGEYQVVGHQKESLIESDLPKGESVGQILSFGTEEGIILKKFQYNWDQSLPDQLFWVETGKDLSILYKKEEHFYKESKINTTLFFRETGFTSNISWEHLPNIFHYKNELFELIEETSGLFLSSYAEKKEIPVQQRFYKNLNQNNWFRIVLYSNLTIEISKS